MTSAAFLAMALNKSVSEAQDQMSRSCFRHAVEVVDVPWNMAAREDVRVPEVEGERTLGTAALHWYTSRASSRSDEARGSHGSFFQVNLDQPSKTLMSRDLIRRTLWGVVHDALALPSNLHSAPPGASR